MDLGIDDRSNSNSSTAFRNAMGSLIMSRDPTGPDNRTDMSKGGEESSDQMSIDGLGNGLANSGKSRG